MKPLEGAILLTAEDGDDLLFIGGAGNLLLPENRHVAHKAGLPGEGQLRYRRSCRQAGVVCVAQNHSAIAFLPGESLDVEALHALKRQSIGVKRSG